MSLIAAIALTSLIAAPVPPLDEVDRARQGLQGEWKVIEFTRGGRAWEAKELVGAKVVFKGNIFTITIGQHVDETTFTLEPKASPATINFMKTDPTFQGRVVSGIFKLEGNKLSICSAYEDAERPKEFKSEEKSRTCLFVLERVKK